MEGASTQAFEFVQKLNEFVIFPTIALLSALALLLFIYGCFIYIVNAGDPAARQQGVRHITWSIVGMVVMLSAYTILLVFANSLGLGDELGCANNPSASGCEGVVIPIPEGGGGTGNPGTGGVGNSGTGGVGN